MAVTSDWDPHMARIQRLYLTENKPLHEVMTIMEINHDFHKRYTPPPNDDLAIYANTE